jgi:hypothetical protein
MFCFSFGLAESGVDVLATETHADNDDGRDDGDVTEDKSAVHATASAASLPAFAGVNNNAPMPNKDASPVRDYLSRIGKRSWSFDNAGSSAATAAAVAATGAGMAGEGSVVVGSVGGAHPTAVVTAHSDAWTLFHELKGKITKTVILNGDSFLSSYWHMCFSLLCVLASFLCQSQTIVPRR